jgi:hypothetical protein
MGKVRNAYKSLVRKHERKSHFEDPSVDGKIILECTLEK